MNRLRFETSPYLLQHANNPVDWYPWGEEALTRAKAENKPILVSIGYAACHWCHVMERESFENEETAALMNQLFINIKIDREERPDLDHIYMDAVQAMTGSGGWPLNVFLTPDAKPFYGGTYYPPARAFNRSSWTEILTSVRRTYDEKRDEVNAQAENLTAHLANANSFGLQEPQAGFFNRDSTLEAQRAILKNADETWGGFGRAPKFPQTLTIQYLLRYFSAGAPWSMEGNATARPEAMNDAGLKQALLSLDKMIEGGIYDQVGGGFARYSTDTEWLAPHFEKMLYDNALLVSVISEAYQLTGRARYREVIMETIDFVQRELMSEDFAFYSALDADSEGVEGKFYVWTGEEIKRLLGNDALLFCAYYDISEEGNWEGHNILRVRQGTGPFAEKYGISEVELIALLARGRATLLAAREKRVRPSLDDKVLLGWNALMNTACSRAYAATGLPRFRDLAIRNMGFLLDRFREGSTNEYFHSWKNNKAKYPAFVDDYAFLIQALIHLQEITADVQWLTKAGELTEWVIAQFSEDETGYFFFTKLGQSDVIVRKKEVYDGAVPSGNAVMAYNLYQLSILLNKREWKERSSRMLASLGQAIIKYPTSFGLWCCLFLEMTEGTKEIAILGPEFKEMHAEILAFYLPHRVLMAAEKERSEFPLLAGKITGNETLIYLCRDFSCLQPVDAASDLKRLITSESKGN